MLLRLYQSGKLKLEGDAKKLAEDDAIVAAYLGGH